MMKSALRSAIRWLPTEIYQDIFDDKHFEDTQTYTLADGYIEDIKLIRQALTIEQMTKRKGK
jgi:hypothetical protein